MAYNDLSESKMTISTPYGPCRGADLYKNDTLSRSRNPENDTLFSGTSPYRKIYECPPGGGFTVLISISFREDHLHILKVH